MKTKQDKTLAIIAAGSIFLISIGLSFVGGVQYGKHHPGTTDNRMGMSQQGQNGVGMGGRRNGGQRPELGTVKTVNGKTFTMDLNGTTKTVTITDSTKFIGDSATSVSAGDKVIVFGATGDNNTVTATRIAVNPTFGGQQQSAPDAGSDSSPDDIQSQ